MSYPTTIVRDADTDDDGTGTTGTIHDNAWKTAIYTRIDAALAILSTTGSWTPIDSSGASLSFTVTVAGRYAKVGPIVIASCGITFPSTASGAAATIGGLPFAADGQDAVDIYFTDYGSSDITGLVVASGTTILFFNHSAAAITNVNLTLKNLRFTAVYRTAS